MKIFSTILLLFLFFLWFGVFANEYYEIQKYWVYWDILQDWTITVNEKIDVNFFQERRWIIRNIPSYYYVLWDWFYNFVDSINVKNHEFQVTEDYSQYSIRIWNPAIYLIWEQSYDINYKIYGLIRNFGSYSELYWNIVWYERDTNIGSVVASINLPKAYTWFTKDDFKIVAGYSYLSIDEWNIENFPWEIDWTDRKITIKLDQKLDSYNWITLAVKFNSGYFNFDHERQASLLMYSYDDYEYKTLEYTDKIDKYSVWWFLFMGLFVFGFWKLMSRRYKKYARKKRKFIVQYDAPKWMWAPEVWTMIDDTIHPHDITALIYTWAANGYLKILQEKEKTSRWFESEKYKLKKLKDLPKNTEEYQKTFFDSIFKKSDEFSLSSRSTFTKYVKKAVSDMQKYINDKDRYTIKNIKYLPNFKTYSFLYVFLALIGFTFLNFIFFGMMVDYEIPVYSNLIWFVFLFAIIIVFQFRLKSKEIHTETGKKLYDHCRWFKKFLYKVDKKKLKTFLKQDPLYFDKILPYAIVFGLESRFIREITPLLKEKPDRYNWDLHYLSSSIYMMNYASSYRPPVSYSSSGSSYSSGGWFSSGSSFGGWFSSGGGGWGWGGSSW